MPPLPEETAPISVAEFRRLIEIELETFEIGILKSARNKPSDWLASFTEWRRRNSSHP